MVDQPNFEERRKKKEVMKAAAPHESCHQQTKEKIHIKRARAQ
jgi:hypothetical protein